MPSLKLLPPSWKLLEKLTYSISHTDNFKFGKTVRKPLSSEYQFSLEYLESTPQGEILNLDFKEGIWNVFKHRQGLGDIVELLDTIEEWPTFSSKIIYSRKGECCDWYNWYTTQEILISYFDDVFKFVDPFTLSKYADYVNDLIESLEKYLLLDVKRVFEHIGLEYHTEDIRHVKEDITENIVEQLENVVSVLEVQDGNNENEIKSVRQKLNLVIKDPSLNERHSAIIFDQNRRTYSIEMLRGSNTVSSNANHNFDEIMKKFNEGTFKFDDYKNITLIHKAVQIEKNKNILSGFSDMWRTVTKDMLKERYIKIELLGG